MSDFPWSTFDEHSCTLVYFLAVVYCNIDGKLETSVILPVLLAASPRHALSKSCPERQFAKYVDQTDSNIRCCPNRYKKRC